MLMLIAVCHIFGSLIAYLESKEEVRENNLILANTDYNGEQLNITHDLLRYSPVDCLDNFTNRTGIQEINLDELRTSLNNCGTQNHNIINSYPLLPLYDDVEDVFATSASDILSLGWTICPYKGKYDYVTLDIGDELAHYVYQQWLKSSEELKQKYLRSGMSELEAKEKSLENADGFDSCHPNHTGGALFFFT